MALFFFGGRTIDCQKFLCHFTYWVVLGSNGIISNQCIDEKKCESIQSEKNLAKIKWLLYKYKKTGIKIKKNDDWRTKNVITLTTCLIGAIIEKNSHY